MRREIDERILDLLLRSNYRQNYMIAILSARKTNASPPFHPDPAGSLIVERNLDVLEDKLQ